MTVIKQFMKVLFSRPERYESYRQQEKAEDSEFAEYETMKQFVEIEDYPYRIWANASFKVFTGEH